MSLNPEIQKSIWLNFSYYRLLSAPVFIGLLFLLSSMVRGVNFIPHLTLMLIGFFIFVIGIKNAAESVLDEVNEATWDFQRLSAISPFSMAWGKLFGSTLYSWYSVAICIIFYAIFALPTASVIHGTLSRIVNDISMIMLCGLSGQAMALLLSVLSIPTIHREKNLKPFYCFILGLLLTLFLCLIAFNGPPVHESSIEWYGMAFDQYLFKLGSMALVLVWTCFALVRAFSKELQYPQIPWAWAAFCIFCVIYFPGLTQLHASQWLLPNADIEVTPEVSEALQIMDQIPYYVAFLVAAFLTYIALLVDHITVLRYVKIQIRLQSQKSWRSVLELLPWWPISLVLTVITCAFVCMMQPPTPTISKEFSVSVVVMLGLGFLIRDILIIHFCYFARLTKRLLLNLILAFILFYFLMPGLLSAWGLKGLLAAFRPGSGQHALIGSIGLIIQIIAIGALCYRRWRDTWRYTVR